MIRVTDTEQQQTRQQCVAIGISVALFFLLNQKVASVVKLNLHFLNAFSYFILVECTNNPKVLLECPQQ